MSKIRQLIKTLNKRPEFFLGIIAVVFVGIYSWLYISTPDIYNSPDETANFVFVENFIQNNSLNIEMGENQSNIVHPRSINIIAGNFVPGSFIGLILLLGYIGKVFGTWFLMLVPSIISVFGVLSFFGLNGRVFGKQVAVYSTILMFFLPQWWHYSAKGFLPNIVFLSLLMIAGYALVRAHELYSKKVPLHCTSWAMLFGLSFSIAITVRPSEVWWVLFVAIVGSYLYRKRLKFSVFLYSILSAIIVAIVWGYWQIVTFGNLFATGYDRFGANGAGEGSSLMTLVFPFGVKIIESFGKFWVFSWQLFWWQIILGVGGVVIFLQTKKLSREAMYYLITWGVISVYLILYYGTWEVSDDLDSEKVSIGISYIRYWLIIYVGLLPFMYIGMRKLVSIFPEKTRTLFFGAIFSALIAGSVFQVYSLGDDNLGRIRESIVKYNNVREEIKNLTSKDSIIISERNDKLFWPERSVIHYQDQNFGFVGELPHIIEHFDVYWYTILPHNHVEIWEQREFSPYHLRLNYVKAIEGSKLYKVESTYSSDE